MGVSVFGDVDCGVVVCWVAVLLVLFVEGVVIVVGVVGVGGVVVVFVAGGAVEVDMYADAGVGGGDVVWLCVGGVVCVDVGVVGVVGVLAVVVVWVVCEMGLVDVEWLVGAC